MTGGIGLAWCLVWFFLARDSPESSNLISPEEKKYILATRIYDGEKDSKDDVPFVPLLM